MLTSADVLGERVDDLSPAVTAIVAPNRQAMVSTGQAPSRPLGRRCGPVTEDTIEIAAALSDRLGGRASRPSPCRRCGTSCGSATRFGRPVCPVPRTPG